MLPTDALSAVSDPTSQDDVVEPSGEDEKKAALRINTYFANIPEYKQPCDDIELHYVAELATHLKAEDRPVMQGMRRDFKKQLKDIKNLRKKTARSAEDMLFSGLTYYHVKDNGIGDAAEAGKELYKQYYNWLVSLKELGDKESKLRALAEAYYKLYFQVYPELSAAEREQVHGLFEKRASCMQKERRDVFEKIEKNRRLLLKIAIDHEFNRTEPNIIDQVNADLKHASLQWAYSWLTPETAFTVSIYKQLLIAEEQLILDRELHPLLLEAFMKDPHLGPDDPVPQVRGSRKLRHRVSEIRARKAALMLYGHEMVLEAGFTKKLSILTGLWEAGAKAWTDLQKSTHLKTHNIPLYSELVKDLALIGIGYKFFSTTLGVVNTQLIKNPSIKIFDKLTGAEVKTASEKSYEQYLNSRKALSLRIKLLNNIATNHSYEQGMEFVKFLRNGSLQSPTPSIGSFAPLTVRGLLEDSDFIAKTNGGLPYIFEILCEDPSDRAAVLLRGAEYEMRNSLRAAYSRLAVNRRITVENPDAMIDRKALLKLFGEDAGDGNVSAFDAAVAYSNRMLFSVIPSVRALKELYDLPFTVRNSVEYLQGKILSQDEYMRKLVTMQGWANIVIKELSAVDYKFGRLLKERPNVYSRHLGLLGGSYEWALAMQKLRSAEWDRSKMYIYSGNLRYGGRVLTPEGEEVIAAAQAGADKERHALSLHGAWLKQVYHTHTANYAAAAIQVKHFQEIANLSLGESEKVDLSGVIAEYEAEALKMELVAVYEELYYKGLEEAAVSVVSSGLSNTLLSLVGKESVEGSVDIMQKLSQTYNPWIGKFSASGVWSTLSGGMTDAIKAGASHSINSNQETLFTARYFTEQQIDKTVDMLWDIGGNVAETTAPLFAEAGVDRYAETENYNRLLKNAEESRRVIEDRYDKIKDDLRKLHGEYDDSETRRKIQEDLERHLAEEADDEPLLLERLRYKYAVGELQEASEKRRVIDERLRNVLAWVPAAEEFKKRLLGAVFNINESELKGFSHIYAASEIKTRLALKVHTVDDLKQLADPSDTSGLRRNVLRPSLDIDLIRGALKGSLKRAENDAERKEVVDIAEGIDEIRINKIDSLLKEFMGEAGNAAQIVAVIQGGAAKGNPEYQGIFGDIDFTIFTRPGSGADDSAIKAKILDFFRKRGYPLAESREKPSSMDSEVFVQPWGRFDASVEERVAILKDVNEKRGDPTRFYSEAGTKWFLNNLHYSGRVLWSGGDEKTRWVDIEPGEGHGLALDMMRYMGSLTDPKYSKGNLDSITDPAQKRAILGDALKKTKYTIRLIDAYQISHSDGEVTGNSLYNRRKDMDAEEGRDASYHWQIYKNAEEMIKAETEGRTRTVFEAGDVEIIRLMAEMKLKGENPSPWDALEKAGYEDDAALEMAERIVRRTEEFAPKILAYTTQKWIESHQRALESSDDGERRQAFNDINRTVSTMRNVMDLDDYGSSVLMVPPDMSIQDADERMKRHADTIRQKMSDAVVLRKKLKADLARIRVIYEPSSDIMGDKGKEEARKMLDERDRQLSMLRGEVNLMEQQQMLPWFRHLMSVAIPLAE